MFNPFKRKDEKTKAIEKMRKALSECEMLIQDMRLYMEIIRRPEPVRPNRQPQHSKQEPPIPDDKIALK